MRKRIVYGFVALGVVCLAALADYAVRGPEAKRHLAFLMNELRAIPDVKDASVTGTFSGSKPSSAGAGRNLISGLPVPEVRAFYTDTLEQQGWQKRCERPYRDRDRIIFGRDEDMAILDLPKTESQITGEYQLQLSWGTNYC
jgi:hypothetical protein